MSKKKKIIIILSMVAVLAVAAYINIALLNKDVDVSDGNVQTASFFVTYREYRQETRSYEVGQLDEILGLEGEEYAAARQDALEQKLKLVEIAELELLLETLLRAQGFNDAVVSVGISSENISVIVSDDELSREETAQIYSIITEETETSPDYIRILAI